jgi:hypothetical protein
MEQTQYRNDYYSDEWHREYNETAKEEKEEEVRLLPNGLEQEKVHQQTKG